MIGILASLVVVTGNSYLKRAAESSARTTLISAASEVKKTFNRQGEYPLLPPIPSTIKIPSRISLTAVNNSSDRQSFCITARVSNYSDIQYYMNQTTSQPQSGACAGEPLSIALESEIRISNGTSFPQSIDMSIQNGTSPYSYQVISGASDTQLTQSPSGVYTLTIDNSSGPGKFRISVPGASGSPSSSQFGLTIIGGSWSSTCTPDPASITGSLIIRVTDSTGQFAEQPISIQCDGR